MTTPVRRWNRQQARFLETILGHDERVVIVKTATGFELRRQRRINPRTLVMEPKGGMWEDVSFE